MLWTRDGDALFESILQLVGGGTATRPVLIYTNSGTAIY